MNGFTNVTVCGRLGRDPELKYIPNGTAVCTIGLAVTEKWQGKESTIWVDCEMWGKQAEFVNEHFGKGGLIAVMGKLKMDEWETKDGQKRRKLLVTARDVTFAGDSGKTRESAKAEADFNADDF